MDPPLPQSPQRGGGQRIQGLGYSLAFPFLPASAGSPVSARPWARVAGMGLDAQAAGQRGPC